MIGRKRCKKPAKKRMKMRAGDKIPKKRGTKGSKEAKPASPEEKVENDDETAYATARGEDSAEEELRVNFHDE